METRFRANKKFYNHDKEPDRFLGIRNILNIIFMLGAVIGLIFYLFIHQTTGTIVILTAMAFKVVECILRFIR